MLENVQIRATKLVDGLGALTYEERLRKLDLPTLAYRRARGDMIEVYKHLHVYDKDTTPGRFVQTNRGNRRHAYQLIRLKPKDGARGTQANSFYFRTTKVWNELPEEVVAATSLNAFKNQLDNAWKDEPSKFDHTHGSGS
jgi:hypothetical protein